MTSAPHWIRVLSIDLGFIDSDAFSILAFHRYDPRIYVERSFKRAGTDVTATCETAARLIGEYEPVKTVVDTGGLGRKIAEEMRSRYGIGLHAAQKTDKDANDRLLAADLRTGRLVLVEPQCQQLIEEFQTLERDLKTGKERSGQENHCIDTVRYGVRACRHYISEQWQPKPQPGSPQWEAEMARRDRERDLRAARERHDAQHSGRLVDAMRSLLQ